MEIYLSYNNGAESLRLPVLPPTVGVEVGNNNTVVNINELGDINLIGKTGLKGMSIEIFFPGQPYSFCDYKDFPDPWVCVEMLENWRLSGNPIRIIVTGTPINLAMSIDKFDPHIKDGTTDVYFTLVLTEFVFTKLVNAKQSKEYKQDTKRPSKEVPKTYTVKAGDTLSIIAKKTTGNSANYKKIAEKNGIKNPNVISVGQVIKL